MLEFQVVWGEPEEGVHTFVQSSGENRTEPQRVGPLKSRIVYVEPELEASFWTPVETRPFVAKLGGRVDEYIPKKKNRCCPSYLGH